MKIDKNPYVYKIITWLILVASITFYTNNALSENKAPIFSQFMEKYINAINSKDFEAFSKLYHPNARVNFSNIQEEWKRSKHSLELLDIETLYAENGLVILRSAIHWKSAGRGIKSCLSKDLVVLKMWENDWRVWLFEVIDFQLIDWDPKTQHGPGES